MKFNTSLFVALFFVLTSFAQNGINYKAVIKDNTGTVIINQPILVQFTILQGITEINVYQETHNPTTNSNGVIIINIGEGSPVSGNYGTIDW